MKKYLINMSIFGFCENDPEDYENCMNEMREKISENINSKSSFYSFNFETSKPIENGKYIWKKLEKPRIRLSEMNFSRSPLLHMHTPAEETLVDIQTKSKIEIELLQKLSASHGVQYEQIR